MGVRPSSKKVKLLAEMLDGCPPAIKMPVSSGSSFAHQAILKMGDFRAKVPSPVPGLKDPGPGLFTLTSCRVLAWMMRPSLASQMTMLLSSWPVRMKVPVGCQTACVRGGSRSLKMEAGSESPPGAPLGRM